MTGAAAFSETRPVRQNELARLFWRSNSSDLIYENSIAAKDTAKKTPIVGFCAAAHFALRSARFAKAG